MKQLPIVGGAPRGKRAGSAPEKASPRGRASHRKYALHAASLWEARPAANVPARPQKKLRPKVGPPTEKYAVHAAPLWEARPAANAGLPAQQHKLRPGGGAPTENMQCTRHHCGRRDPRRKRRSARSKAQASPRGRASNQRSGARRPICGASYSAVVDKQSPVSSRPDERCGAAPARVAARTGATRVQPLRHES